MTHTLRSHGLASLMVVSLALVGGCASQSSYADRVVAGPEKQLSATAYDLEEIILELPQGEVRVNAVSAGTVEATLEIRCEPGHGRCERLADDVTLERQLIENRLYIRPSKRSQFSYRGAQSHYDIQVPDSIPLRIDMGFGALSVNGSRSDLTVNLNAGDVDIHAPRASVGKVWADANVGDAQLYGADGNNSSRRLLVGAEAEWNDGPGQHAIKVDIGAGDVSVTLTD